MLKNIFKIRIFQNMVRLGTRLRIQLYSYKKNEYHFRNYGHFGHFWTMFEHFFTKNE